MAGLTPIWGIHTAFLLLFLLFVQVDLIEGQNSITLAATGHSGPDIDMLEVNPINGRSSVSMHGVIHITADNGYVLYINGDRIGAGGAGLPATDGSRVCDV